MYSSFEALQNPSASFILSDDTICVGDSVIFISQSLFADSSIWNLSNGYSFEGNSFELEFNDTANIDLTLTVFNDNGCTDSINLLSGVVVIEPPEASFIILDTVYDPFSPYAGSLHFGNQSLNSDYYYWEFPNGEDSYQINPIYDFHFYDEAYYNFVLNAYNGCGVDTAVLNYLITYEKGLFVPNSIYPGNIDDGLGTFNAVATGLVEFHIMIFDTYGNVIWESNKLNDKGEPQGGWNGTYKGKYLGQDVYVWTVEASFKDGTNWPESNKFKKSGTVTLIR